MKAIKKKVTKNFSDESSEGNNQPGCGDESPGGNFQILMGLKEPSPRRWFGETEDKGKRVI